METHEPVKIKMASSPSKTPTLKKEKKEESFLEKVTTLGRKKKVSREGKFLHQTPKFDGRTRPNWYCLPSETRPDLLIGKTSVLHSVHSIHISSTKLHDFQKLWFSSQIDKFQFVTVYIFHDYYSGSKWAGKITTVLSLFFV